jgi:hypothetical protein
MPLPSVYYCEGCKHKGLEASFKIDKNHLCPKCKSEDVFPTRWFKCNTCGRKGEQDEFFGIEVPKDDHPVQDNWGPPICPNLDTCVSHMVDGEYRETAPTKVTEIPVPGFAA